MSDQQEKTRRLIAQARALMEKARVDVRITRDVLDRHGFDPEKAQQRFRQAYGDRGPEVFQELVERQRQAAQVHLQQDSPLPVPAPTRGKRLHRMV